MAGVLEKGEVERYLASRFDSPVTINKMKQSFPGLSRETWMVDATVGGEAMGLIVRTDPPEGSSVPTSLAREWGIYKRLYGSEIPVPEPLWYDEGLEFLNGRPHMIRRMVDGRNSIPGLMDQSAEGARLRQSVARECMAKLAMLHKFDWQSHGLGDVLSAPAGPATALADSLAEWRGRWESRRPEFYPIIDEALAWLAENCPSDTPRVSLVKGNNGVGEEIWNGTTIAAMCDWEMAELGDGALDLLFSQGTMSLNGFDETLGFYEEYMGERVSPERIAASFFIIALKRVVGMRCGLYRSFLDGNTNKIFALSLGFVHGAGAHNDLARVIGKNIVDAYRSISMENAGVYGQGIYSALGGGRKK